MRRRDFSYKKCIEALSILSKLKLNSFGINSTIGPDNCNNLIDLYNIAKAYNCNLIQMIPVCGSGRANEEGKFLSESQRLDVKRQMHEIQKMIKENHYATDLDAPEGYIEKHFDDFLSNGVEPDIMGCSAGKTCLAIQQNGKVAFCLMERKPMGDLTKQNFKEVFRRSTKLAMENKMKFCIRCKHNKICYGPCMVTGNSCDCNNERELIVNKVLKI